MMKLNYIIILMLGLLITSCVDYSDHRIQISDSIPQNVLDTTKIDLCIIGKEKLTYEIKIKYKGEKILSSELESSINSETQTLALDLSLLETRLTDLSYDIIKYQKTDFEIIATNEEKELIIDTIFTIHYFKPPISVIHNISINNAKSTTSSDLQTHLINVRKKFNKLDNNNSYKIAFLSALISNNSSGLHNTISPEFDSPLRTKDEINIVIETDTTFIHTIIGRYPSKNNKFYNDINLEKVLKEYITSNLDSISTDWNGKKQNGHYIIEDKIKANYSGVVGLYLINIDQFGHFTFLQVGSFLADAVAPTFSNSKYCSEPDNPKIEGIVCLDNEHFYGLYTRVPFIGRVYGDIKTIYVNNVKIPFKLGEELYFKQRMTLDMGYNRVPIKVIDYAGNVTESYIPITMESDTDNDINIDNNINIDNY